MSSITAQRKRLKVFQCKLGYVAGVIQRMTHAADNHLSYLTSAMIGLIRAVFWYKRRHKNESTCCVLCQIQRVCWSGQWTKKVTYK